jgi:zinc/manganese transport system substrate-binding protein
MLLPALLAASGFARAAPIPVIAAESTYGAIAQAVGGPYVNVDSILRSPDVDPHTFEATPATARAVARARIVLLNGLGYDEWMRKLLAAAPSPRREVVVAAEVGRAWVMADGNPHVFYDTRVADAVAARVATLLQRDDPAHAAEFARNLIAFRVALAAVDARVAQLRRAHPGLKVAATEPVFAYMLRALGWTSSGQRFQLDVMNGTEPPPAVVARFEDELRARRVALLIYNRQVSEAVTQRMREVAGRAAIARVGIDEIAPPGVGYAAWLQRSLDAVEAALHSVALR